MSNKTKTVYDEAIADVKKLKELAESRARDAVLLKVEPQLKRLVEQHLFSEGDELEGDEDEDDLDENTLAAGGIQGSMSGPGSTDESDVQYEVTEGAESTLAQLADFTHPVTDDRFAVEVYRLQEDIQRLVVADRKEKLSKPFSTQLEEAISKLEDMYAYLRESYTGTDRDAIEIKLEKGYGLVNAVKESTMKMRDLLNEEDLTVKINNLPDGVDPDSITIDVVADEADAADPTAPPAGDPAAMGAPPMPTAEGDEEDDEVLEISEADLTAELSRLRGLREGDATPPPTKGHGPGNSKKAFGDAHDEGDAFESPDSELDDIDESDVVEGDEVTESDEVKMESVRKRLARAAKRLSESRGSDREDFARAMYRSAVKAYRGTRQGIVESNKNVASASKNGTAGKQLAETAAKLAKANKALVEAQLLNAKLIHANKLLRLEGLTKAQQAMVIDRLDEARNLREVRLISENIKAVLVGSKGSVNESASRRPSGSASRPSQSGTASAKPLTEGLETARWATLAGLK